MIHHGNGCFKTLNTARHPSSLINLPYCISVWLDAHMKCHASANYIQEYESYLTEKVKAETRVNERVGGLFYWNVYISTLVCFIWEGNQFGVIYRGVWSTFHSLKIFTVPCRKVFTGFEVFCSNFIIFLFCIVCYIQPRCSSFFVKLRKNVYC